jgi:predicted Zn-ribbon and HTH transcriptional regulator
MVKAKADAEIGMVMLLGCRCRCGHAWLPRESTDRPTVCPKCKSPRWDKPKKFERDGKTGDTKAQ